MLRAVGRATVADLVTIDVVGASLAVGVYRLFSNVAVVMAFAMRAVVFSTVAVTMRGCELRPAQTKHDCERKNRYRLPNLHELSLPVEHASVSDLAHKAYKPSPAEIVVYSPYKEVPLIVNGLVAKGSLQHTANDLQHNHNRH
jgi:hypothetical protein